MVKRIVTDEELIEALATMSNRQAARHLGINARTLTRRRALLARKGWSPGHDLTHPVPEGFQLRGASTLYGADGKLKLQWVKSQADLEAQRAMLLAAVQAMAEDIPPCAPVAPPAAVEADLLNCYVITDYHLGMLAWHEETRAEDWDLRIAEDLLVGWFACAIAQSPAAERAVFAQMGDYLHWDGLDAVTPTSRHLVDADGRFTKLVRVAIRALRRVITMLLAKHAQVHVIIAEGNHDLASSIWLRELMGALYEQEPRITVERSPDPYYCVEHGLTSVFVHHGHKRKLEALDDVLVAKFRDVFGRTRFSYAHTGHLHHNVLRETNLMVLEQHRTLAPKDAYASRGGWMAGREAKVITYSKRFGEVGRVVISPDMVSG